MNENGYGFLIILAILPIFAIILALVLTGVYMLLQYIGVA